MITRKQLEDFVPSLEPEKWPTLDELPETEVSDLVLTYQETTRED